MPSGIGWIDSQFSGCAGSSVSAVKNPNPQGKGLVPVLDCLYASRIACEVPAKTVEQISSELFTSLFVLHSRFSFKPVPGKTYFLYEKQGAYKLSLISPLEWGGSDFGRFVAECELQADMSWSLNLDPGASKDPELMQRISRKRQEFDQFLGAVPALEQALPEYLHSLPFYQRVYASALAHSLKTSMRKAGIAELSFSGAKSLSFGPT